MLPNSCDVALFLHGADVACLQAIDVTTQILLAEADVWLNIIKREMPRFLVDESLLRDCALKPLVVRCFGFLSLSIFSSQCVIQVSSANDLKRLETKLKNAARARRAHLRSGGCAACVLVGDFVLTRDSPAPWFPFELDQSLLLCGHNTGKLELKVCIEDGHVMVGAKYHEVESSSHDAALQARSVFTANFTSVNSAVSLSFRGACLSTDGNLRRLPIGFCSYALGQGALDQRCFSSLCVVTLMDGSPREAPCQIANVLSMDALANHYPSVSP
eukprot:TRINITY_DN9061_c1_g1_i1.p1 TRINITY_DN9061_c1_g1~~TRINITY_DN9061_c1_g1_i1.p1  ORF type:complete len:273 (+),score=33.95 TRINITY_DN9061_c1_g1_i1:25-843(+)